MVVAHPVPESLTHSAARAAVDGLTSAGHEVAQIDLYGDGFSPAMSRAERASYHTVEPLITQDAIRAAELVRRAQILVFVYPTWWSDVPAIMRGFFERVFIPTVAFDLVPGATKVRPAMQHVRHLVGISIYGSPWMYVRAIGDNGRKMITRALRLCTGRKTHTTWLALYNVERADAPVRRAFLERVEASMAALS
ncbi:MAG: NAD(P)H-dependent oxidoreductase [Actinomycetota bacterium]|nr:NAD(P)H-dependent oxidoreductase [Actinomycetota bacterium]